MKRANRAKGLDAILPPLEPTSLGIQVKMASVDGLELGNHPLGHLAPGIRSRVGCAALGTPRGEPDAQDGLDAVPVEYPQELRVRLPTAKGFQ